VARNNDTAVFSVIFPENQPFFEEFTQSLLKQTRTDFDLVLLNDGLSSIPDCFNGLNCKVFNAKENLAKTRQLGLQILIEEGYEQVIFADSDDLLSENRVEVSLTLLEKADLIANDLNLINQKGELFLEGFWKDRIPNHTEIDASFIRDKNIFGLGNSAAKGSFLKNLNIPETLKVVDWYIFLNLLTQDHRALFTSDTYTHYRIRPGNLGSFGEVNELSVYRCLQVKKQYYGLMATESEYYSDKLASILQIEEQLEDENVLRKFVDNRSKEITNPFWWEEVMEN